MKIIEVTTSNQGPFPLNCDSSWSTGPMSLRLQFYYILITHILNFQLTEVQLQLGSLPSFQHKVVTVKVSSFSSLFIGNMTAIKTISSTVLLELDAYLVKHPALRCACT